MPLLLSSWSEERKAKTGLSETAQLRRLAVPTCPRPACEPRVGLWRPAVCSLGAPQGTGFLSVASGSLSSSRNGSLGTS